MRTFLASIFCKRTIHEYQNKVYELSTRCNDLRHQLAKANIELKQSQEEANRFAKALKNEVESHAKSIDEMRIIKGERNALSIALDCKTKELEIAKITNAHVCKERDELARKLQPKTHKLNRTNIEKALTDNNGNRTLAAKALGVSERTIYRKMAEYRLEQRNESKD